MRTTIGRLMVALLGLTVGCGEDWKELPGCDDYLAGNFLEGAQLDTDVDYVGVYSGSLFVVEDGTQELRQGAMGEWGEPCATADDRERCLRTFEDFTITCVDAGVACEDFVLWTEGDRIFRSTERDQLLAMLGRIDTPSEAIAVAFWDGHPISCENGDLASTRVREDGSGYVVESETYGDCGGQDERISLEVGADGRTGGRERESFGDERECVE